MKPQPVSVLSQPMKEGSGPREENPVVQEGDFYFTFHFDFEVEIFSIQSKFHEKVKIS